MLGFVGTAPVLLLLSFLVLKLGIEYGELLLLN